MFVPLNTKTEYSFLDSMVRVSDYIKTAAQMGYQTIGMCDNGNLHAAYRFIQMAKEKQLRAVIAIELAFELFDFPMSMAFIAKNTTGYKNLLRISTLYNEGHTQFSAIKAYLSGLAIVIPEAYGDLSALTELKNQAELYVGITHQTSPKTTFTLPIIPFDSVRYLASFDQATLEVLHAIRNNTTFEEGKTQSNKELLLRPEVYEKFYQKNFPQALKNLSVLTENISYALTEKLDLPQFDKTQDAQILLEKMAEKGLSVRKKTSPTYRDRLRHELNVIHTMGFDNYFLIVGDLLAYAKRQGIYCGMGRGSAAGSLVAYALQITHVDPVANALIFERFLNPERVAMPDIDIDMPDDRRSELLDYMKRKYGSDHVAQIVTFSTFGKRQALRDCAKAFKMTEIEITGLTKMLTPKNEFLEDEYLHNPKFKSELLKNATLHQVYERARRIEGMPRQTSTHASGVVLSDDSLINHVPLKPSEDLFLTQYEAHDVEALGLLKIDFLGLRNLTLLAQMRKAVLDKQKIDIDPLNIDLEDSETLALFRAGDTQGIFQFENPQMRRFLKNLAPTTFDDLVDATSIFRPGPSQFIPQFVARRNTKEPFQSIDPSLTEILAPTYGIMIYQEQIMQVAQKFAGFSLGKADLLRRAISKKKENEFEQLQSEFLAGAMKNGHDETQAQKIYALIERFANYGFNRSHAYAYAALAVQIAYFKAHFPAEFYEVQLKDRKREQMITDALAHGLTLEPLSINQSPYHDRIQNNKISLGLSHLQNLQRDFAYWIVENRPFKNLEAFIRACPEKFQKEETLKTLISVGLFDQMDANRGKLLFNVSNLMDYVQNIQFDLFKDSPLKFSYQAAKDLSQAQKYEIEKATLGVGITPHPIVSLAQIYQGNFTPLTQLQKNSRATLLVEVLYIRVHRAKNGQNMAFLTCSDSQNKMDITLFSETYRHYETKLEKGNFYFITGKVTERNEQLQLVADRIALAQESDIKLWLNLKDASKNTKLHQILKEFPGQHQVILHFSDRKTTQQTTTYVDQNEMLIKRLEGYVQNAVFK
ncbi:DNA polymerase III subunit alpha [Lactococcus hircilactis]|uniref:DNA polymerase III subunit alpha n=1 Tax=Lactococcus hircilactis TaxID=1494462 RepID=A0A7X1Z985_9LACT|nr:DNA polymerase III subunit alpha [Lactococcus hircilactis]MQW40153.1 DNA polymerase III subunit alpha [Lactococcus hircilactis]